LFIEAVLEPFVQQRHTKQHYEGQDLIKRSPFVYTEHIPSNIIYM